MYERFTDRARKVMKLALAAATRLNHNSIGTEHILLGLLEEGGGVAAQVLRNADVDLDHMRKTLESRVTPGPAKPPQRRGWVGLLTSADRIPQTPAAKKVIEHAMEEARAMRHNYVGTEHLLLALLRDEPGLTTQTLIDSGITLDDARAEVLRLLGYGLE